MDLHKKKYINTCASIYELTLGPDACVILSRTSLRKSDIIQTFLVFKALIWLWVRLKYSQIQVPDLSLSNISFSIDLCQMTACQRNSNNCPITVLYSVEWTDSWLFNQRGRGCSCCLRSLFDGANMPLDALYWDWRCLVGLCLGSDDISCVCKVRVCVGRK